MSAPMKIKDVQLLSCPLHFQEVVFSGPDMNSLKRDACTPSMLLSVSIHALSMEDGLRQLHVPFIYAWLLLSL